MQLLWHLSYQGADNRLLRWCSLEQREAVYGLLQQLAAERAEDLENYALMEDLRAALAAWKPPTRLRR